MKVCSHCGFKVLDNQRYCAKCGFPIDSANSQTNNIINNEEETNEIEKTIRLNITDTHEKKHVKKPILIITVLLISVLILSVIIMAIKLSNIDTTPNIVDNKNTNEYAKSQTNSKNTNTTNNTNTTGTTTSSNTENKLSNGEVEISNQEKTNNNNQSSNSNTNNQSSQVNTAEVYIKKYSNRAFIIEDSAEVELTYSAINHLSEEELFIARNEMFARYGYTFAPGSNLQSFFESKDWYSPSSEDFSKFEFDTQIEEDNCNLIKALEFVRASANFYPPISSDFVFPNSNSVLLSSSDVSSLNNWELIIATNEIYARYGYRFSISELQDHFNSKSWYVNITNPSNDIVFSDIEDANLKTIVKEKDSRVKDALMHDLGK